MFEALTGVDWEPVTDAGLTLTLVGALIGTWRWIISELRRERDYWRATALANLGLAEKGVDVARSARESHDAA